MATKLTWDERSICWFQQKMILLGSCYTVELLQLDLNGLKYCKSGWQGRAAFCFHVRANTTTQKKTLSNLC